MQRHCGAIWGSPAQKSMWLECNQKKSREVADRTRQSRVLQMIVSCLDFIVTAKESQQRIGVGYWYDLICVLSSLWLLPGASVTGCQARKWTGWWQMMMMCRNEVHWPNLGLQRDAGVPRKDFLWADSRRGSFWGPARKWHLRWTSLAVWREEKSYSTSKTFTKPEPTQSFI